MLKFTQEGLLEELNASEARLRPFLDTYEKDLLRICGPAYGGNIDFILGDPENHWQEWLSIFLPQLVYGNPHCSVSPDNIAWVPERAKAVEASLNTWGRITDIRHELERCMVDFAVRWCCGTVQPMPVAGHEGAEDPPYLPGFARLSPLDVRWDPTTKDIHKGRWTAHRVVHDIDDLIESVKKGEATGWDLPALEVLAQSAGADSRENIRKRAPGIERRQLVVWELWARGHKIDGAPSEKKGFHGTLFTVLDTQHATSKAKDFIREPRPFFGRRKGPHIIQGAMLIGDLCEPLSQLVATTPQAVYLNKVARAVQTAVEDYKRMMVTTDAGLADKIASGLDGSVYSVEGIDVRQVVQSIEVGGLNQQLLAAKEDARQTLDRNSGLHEAQRGNVTGVATATEVQAANASSMLRSSFLVQKANCFVREIYECAAFYFDLDADVVLDLGDGMQARGGIPRQQKDKWNALDHERLALVIDPYSMSRTDEQTKQIRLASCNAALQMVASLPPTIGPAFNLPWYLGVVQEASGLRDIDQMFDPEVYYQLQSMALQSEQVIQPAPKKSGSPRFLWNSSSYANPGASPGGSRAAGGKPAQTMKMAAPKPGAKAPASSAK